MARRKFINPFYPIVVIIGVLFCITAFSYGIMTVQQLQAASGTYSEGSRFMEWIEEQGTTLMIGELIALGIGTALAIALDGLMGADSFFSKKETHDETDDASSEQALPASEKDRS